MVSGEGQSPGLQGRREYEASPSDPRRSHAQEEAAVEIKRSKSHLSRWGKETIWISKAVKNVSAYFHTSFMKQECTGHHQWEFGQQLCWASFLFLAR